jgi:hypothetical protein
MNLLFKQSRLIPPIQFLQPFSHCLAAGFTQIAMVTVRMVDSQKGQQVATQLHDLLAEFKLLASGEVLRSQRGELLFAEARILCHTTPVQFQEGFVSDASSAKRRKLRGAVLNGAEDGKACRRPRSRFQTIIPYFLAARIFAHLARCAAAIFPRADAHKMRVSVICPTSKKALHFLHPRRIVTRLVSAE